MTFEISMKSIPLPKSSESPTSAKSKPISNRQASLDPAAKKLLKVKVDSVKVKGWKRVYDELHSRILSLELPPGSSIDEASIVKLLGVSRTPVREAIIHLAAEGLVIQQPNRSANVAPLDLARIRDYLEGIDLIQRAATRWTAIRRTEEGLVLIKRLAIDFEKAAKNRDSDRMVRANHDFHMAIGASCGNFHISDAYGRLLSEGLRIARFTLNGHYYRSQSDYYLFIESIISEHRETVAAIERRDANAAESVAAIHTEHTRSRFVEFLNDSLSLPSGVKSPSTAL